MLAGDNNKGTTSMEIEDIINTSNTEIERVVKEIGGHCNDLNNRLRVRESKSEIIREDTTGSNE